MDVETKPHLTCPFCDEKLPNRSVFQEHLLKNHVEPVKSQVEEVKTHKCPICNIVVKDELALIKHGLIAHKDDFETDVSEGEKQNSFVHSQCIKKEIGNHSSTNSAETAGNLNVSVGNTEKESVEEVHEPEVRIRLLRKKKTRKYNEDQDIDIPAPVVRRKKRGRPPKNATAAKYKKNESLICCYCDYTAPNKYSLFNHVSNKHNKGEKDTEDLLAKAIGDCFCLDAGISKNHKCGKQKENSSSKPQACMYCPFKAESRQMLREHALLYHKEQMRQCPICDFVALSRRQLYEHTYHKHQAEKKPVTKNLPCNYCSFNAESRKALVKHGLLNHKEFVRKCSTCDYVAMSEKQLYSHNYNKHQEKEDVPYLAKLTRHTHQCEYCNFADKMDKLVEHRLSKHKDKMQTYNCPSCQFETYEESLLNGHVIIEHKEHSKLVDGLICCPACNYTTMEYVMLKKHYRKRHRDRATVRETKYRCDAANCNYISDGPKEFNAHRVNVHGMKPPNSCLEPGCDYVGRFRKHLRSHLESVHNLPMKIDTFHFATENDFTNWMRSMETDTCARYIQSHVKKGYVEYMCNRSGRHYIPERDRVKVLKKKKSHTSVKSGATCTSTIAYTKHPEGHVTVEACLTHYGHEMSAEVLHYSHNEKMYLREKILAGESYGKIIDDIRNDLVANPNIKLQRLHLVTKHYLMDIKRTLRRKNVNLPKVRSKQKEKSTYSHSFDKALANRIEQKLSALKAHTNDLSSSSLLEIDKRLSALDELVGTLPSMEKLPSMEEDDSLDVASAADKSKPPRKRKRPLKKDLHEESPKHVYLGAHSSEGLCIDHSQQPQHPQQQQQPQQQQPPPPPPPHHHAPHQPQPHHQQIMELHPNRPDLDPNQRPPAYFDLSQAQISVLHTVQPTQGYTTNFEDFSHFIT